MVTELNRLTGIVVDSAYRIHSKIGPGLLESVYETILARDLVARGLQVERQKVISFGFEGLWFEDAYRADIVVQNAVVVEVKSLESIATVHEKQLMTYLRVLDYRVGLLLNFGAPLIKDGIRRLVNRI